MQRALALPKGKKKMTLRSPYSVNRFKALLLTTSLIHLLNCWAASSWRSTATEAATWHSTFWHTTTTCCLVDLHHDRIHDTLQFLLLCFELILLSQLVLVQPIQSLLNSFFDLVLVPC